MNLYAYSKGDLTDGSACAVLADSREEADVIALGLMGAYFYNCEGEEFELARGLAVHARSYYAPTLDVAVCGAVAAGAAAQARAKWLSGGISLTEYLVGKQCRALRKYAQREDTTRNRRRAAAAQTEHDRLTARLREYVHELAGIEGAA